MKKEEYSLIESYMHSCAKDSAHDREHLYRVLYGALDIAEYEDDVDYDVLICACLLHDVARQEQYENPALCHAIVGGAKVFDFLIENGFEEIYAEKVKRCVETHRFRSDNPPASIEAKILFDADKIDVAGAIGIARTLVYKGHLHQPLYSRMNGQISDGTKDEVVSFFQEYKKKLENIYSKFYTKRGNEIALSRQKVAVDFYDSLLGEVKDTYDIGSKILGNHIY